MMMLMMTTTDSSDKCMTMAPTITLRNMTKTKIYEKKTTENKDTSAWQCAELMITKMTETSEMLQIWERNSWSERHPGTKF